MNRYNLLQRMFSTDVANVVGVLCRIPLNSQGLTDPPHAAVTVGISLHPWTETQRKANLGLPMSRVVPDYVNGAHPAWHARLV